MPGTMLFVLLLCLVVGLGCWLGFQLVRQSGRMLLRLEALEHRMEQLAAGGVHSPAASREAVASPRGLTLGSAGPDFALPDLTGQRHALSDFRGRKLLVIFFDPGCGFCQRMGPELEKLPLDGADGKPFRLLISTGGAERNRGLASEHALRCPVLLQEATEVASAYQAHGTPMGYLLDEDGRIASPLAVGAQALLRLADGKPFALPEPNGNDHGPRVGTRDLSQSRIPRGGLNPGTPAPDFRLPTLEGRELSLAEFRGRKVLLVFSDPRCGPCQVLMPLLEGLSGTDGGAGVRRNGSQVVVISRGDVAENREKADRHGVTFPIALQRKWEISKQYGMFATPVGYLIDEEGVIAAPVATGPEPILELARSAAGTRPFLYG